MSSDEDVESLIPGLTEGDQPRASGREQIRRALAFVKPDRTIAIVAMTLSLLGAALGAVEPLMLTMVVDHLVAGSAVEAVAYTVLGLLAVGIIKEVANAAANWLTWRVRLRAHYRVLERVADRLHNLPVTFHREQSVGSLMTRVERGIQGYVNALTNFSQNILPAIAFLSLALFLMFQMEWRLALVVLAFAPLPAIIGAWAAREQTQRERRLLDWWSRIYSRFNEVLSGIVTVKSFSMEDAEKSRFLRSVGKAQNIVDRGVARDTSVEASKNTIAMTARIAALGVGGWLVLNGQTTVGTLVGFLGYIQQLFGPVQGMTETYQTMRKASVSLDAIYGIIEAPDHMKDAPDARDVPVVKGDVQFENVSFGYKPGENLIHDVNLDVKEGETVAIVGPSGAGKSTLMSLLQRMYDPTEGRVLVDGQDVREVKQRDLRRHTGVVLQEALLFNDSVRNAIAYAKPDATEDEVEAAAKAANAHDFIMALPEGYDTPVGERGSRLSGGERQRIAIARALLKDPSILILDEATSALDAESEALVQDALNTLVKGRTTFVIAHRLATVVNADRIVVLKDGEIHESGSHQDLMWNEGHYATLVRHQTEGLLDVDHEVPAQRTIRPRRAPASRRRDSHA